MHIWVVLLSVAPFPFREKSKSPIVACEQGAWDCPHLLLLSPIAPLHSQKCPNYDDEWYDCPTPMSCPHSLTLYIFSQVAWLWEHFSSLVGGVPGFQLWLLILVKGTLLTAHSCICSGQVFCKLEYMSILTCNYCIVCNNTQARSNHEHKGVCFPSARLAAIS